MFGKCIKKVWKGIKFNFEMPVVPFLFVHLQHNPHLHVKGTICNVLLALTALCLQCMN